MITISNLRVSYGGNQAVSSLSLTVKPGSLYALLGPNGAGKTTTIHCLLGFVTPDSGRIELNNQVLLPGARRERVAYIPENLKLYESLTGAENLAYFTSLGGASASTSELSQFLTKAGLAGEHHHRRVSTYSKGMRQKVGIAIAMAVNASVLLLDEPASGLDPRAAMELTTQLKQLASTGVAILMTTHDLFRAWEAADTIGIMKQGRLVEERETSGLSMSELETLYLDNIHAS
jgi:ABC-2 type transport system ATP-binding protein